MYHEIEQREAERAAAYLRAKAADCSEAEQEDYRSEEAPKGVIIQHALLRPHFADAEDLATSCLYCRDKQVSGGDLFREKKDRQEKIQFL